jgi:uncharacterized protein with ParB-like and HNH nuclease domain
MPKSSANPSTQTIDSDDFSINELLTDFYNVPNFQREYVWGEEQVEQLFQDINIEFQDNGHDSEYFIGSIVVCPSGNQLFDLIDGQQRLTTLYIFLCCLRDFFEEKNIEKDLVTVIKNQISATVVNKNGNVEFHYRLELQYDDNQGVLKRLAEGKRKDEPAPVTKSSTNILNAYDSIREFLVNEFKDRIPEIKQYYAFVLNQVKVVRIKTASVTHALKVFETINDRGVGLDAMDLLKNLLFLNTNNSEFNKLKGLWKELTDTIYRAKEKPLRFLRYYILANFNVEKLKEEGIYSWLTKNKSLCHYDVDPIGFVEDLLACSRAYECYLKGNNTDGTANKYLQNIKFLSGSARQHLILLLAARNLPLSNFYLFTKHIENLFFAFIITREPAREFERMFARWAPIIRKCKDQTSIENFIEKYLDPEKQNLKLRFVLALDEVRYDNIQKYRLRYLLGKMVQYINELAFGQGQSDLAMFLKQQDVEHIMAETITEKILEEFGCDLQTAKDYSQKLGNLTLLEEPINRSIHNLPFSTKIKKYSDSQYLLTKVIAYAPGEGAIKRAIEGLHQYSTWTKESIDSRQKELISIAKKCWEID